MHSLSRSNSLISTSARSLHPTLHTRGYGPLYRTTSAICGLSIPSAGLARDKPIPKRQPRWCRSSVSPYSLSDPRFLIPSDSMGYGKLESRAGAQTATVWKRWGSDPPISIPSDGIRVEKLKSRGQQQTEHVEKRLDRTSEPPAWRITSSAWYSITDSHRIISKGCEVHHHRQGASCKVHSHCSHHMDHHAVPALP